jgi:hypothetical protein
LPTNFRLCWASLPGKNTPAYWANHTPLSEAQIGTPLGQAPALLTNIGQGSPMTNTSTYFSAALVKEKNSFLVEMRDGMSCKLAYLRLLDTSILF